jgi:hypothetical protein
MTDGPDYTEQQPFRRILSETRTFRLPAGLDPVRVIPEGTRRFVPAGLDICYQVDWCPERPGGDSWAWQLWSMRLRGEGTGAFFWTYHELRGACPEAAALVSADATTFLTEKNGSAPRWLTSPTTPDSPSPNPAPTSPAPTTG